MSSIYTRPTQDWTTLVYIYLWYRQTSIYIMGSLAFWTAVVYYYGIDGVSSFTITVELVMHLVYIYNMEDDCMEKVVGDSISMWYIGIYRHSYRYT